MVPSPAALGSATPVPVGSEPYAVAVGDFNGDGMNDLAVANYGGNSVSILLGNGQGGFSLAETLTSGISHPHAVAVGNFNAGGKLDLAVTSYTSQSSNGVVKIFLNNGSTTSPFSSTASSSVNLGGREPFGLAVGNFGNGYNDLVVANYGPSTNHDGVQILWNNGSGTFTALTEYTSTNIDEPDALAVGYFNGASEPLDVAVASYANSKIVVLDGSGSSSGSGFSSGTTYSNSGVIVSPTCIAVGNLNGDGYPDIVEGNYSNSGSTVGILLNNGSGGFPTTSTYSTGGNGCEGVAIADFNADGYADVVATNYGSNNVGVLLNNGDGTFAAANTVSTGSGPYAVATGDFNGDGKPDVVVTDALSGANSVSVLLNTYAVSSVPLTTPDGWTFNVATGQFGPGEFISGSGTGSFSGENNAFNGYGRLYVGGSLYSPTTATYSAANGGQSLLLGSGTAAGLTVSGEVTVPDTGSQDFARTIDTFTNSSGSTIATTVQIVANLGSGLATTVFATSDGTGLVSANDEWIGTDGGGTPAIITYIDGPLSLQPTAVSLSGGDLQWTFNIKVAAGQTVNLAYFTIMAPTTTAAEAAANVLVGSGGFGGQAGAFLSTTELQSLATFANPSPALTPPAAPTAGVALRSVNLFHFYDTSAGGIASDTATIIWGDGTFSTVTSTPGMGGRIVADPNGGYDVLGSHVYMEPILSPVTLSVVVSNGAGTIGASDADFTVADAPLAAGALTPPAASQDVAFSNVAVFHFTDANSYMPVGDFSAVITWGDGNSSTVTSTAGAYGKIVADPNGGFDVLGSYLYTQQLSGATFSVQVSDNDGSSTGASQGNFSVADAPYGRALTPPVASQDVAFSNVLLFYFTDADPGATAAEYTAVITWGDGNTSTVTSTANAYGQIVADAGGFDVVGSYLYTQQLERRDLQGAGDRPGRGHDQRQRHEFRRGRRPVDGRGPDTAGGHPGRGLQQRAPLPLHRRRSQRHGRRVHGGDHLGRRQYLDRDQHGRRLRPDRGRRRRLRRPRLVPLHPTTQRRDLRRAGDRPGRGHDRKKRREFQRGGPAADGRALARRRRPSRGLASATRCSSISATPIPPTRPRISPPSSPGATATLRP